MNIVHPDLWLAFYLRALTYKMIGKSEDVSTISEHAFWAQDVVGNDIDKVTDLISCCEHALTLKSYTHFRYLIHGVKMGLEAWVLRRQPCE